jgi:hypothetical protein
MELGNLIADELERARRAAAMRKPIVQYREVSTGEAIRRMTDAVMPAVQRDSRRLAKMRSENELMRAREERQRNLLAQ